jgi:hypothetical protein
MLADRLTQELARREAEAQPSAATLLSVLGIFLARKEKPRRR